MPPLNFSRTTPTPTQRFGGENRYHPHVIMETLHAYSHIERRLRMCTHTNTTPECVLYARVFSQHENSIVPGSRSSSHLSNTQRRTNKKNNKSRIRIQLVFDEGEWDEPNGIHMNTEKEEGKKATNNYGILCHSSYIHQNSCESVRAKARVWLEAFCRSTVICFGTIHILCVFSA